MTPAEILKKYFGYDDFRSGQEEIINDILAGKDVVGVMPTGAGKSICFQMPALMMEGITLVVSPLISLMKDQVNALTQSGIAAAFINSSLNERQIYKALRNACNGAYKLIYVAPERLLTPGFLSFAENAKIAMLTVDEAHCISQWGQDFRPSYARIPEFVDSLPSRPVISAFTATATQKVRLDIIKLLRLNDPTVLVTGFDRKNLYFEVRKPKDKFKELTVFLEGKRNQSGIVYCTTRAAVEEVCQGLIEKGYKASRYHAGLTDQERHENQDAFIYDRYQIMVATNAFGMGIDKSNVSFVVHYNMPKDLESYYQEAGRAGRDGEPAQCVLLYSGQDVRTNMWLIENARDVEYPDKETEEMLKERDRKRLKEMTFYCSTYDCLRGYILKYFGEKPQNNCDNCGNCIADYVTEDVTIEAQKILSAVVRMNERYGVNMVIDVLRGSKSERITRFGLNKLSTYAISDKTDGQLREIINNMILLGYLTKTNDEYPVVKLGSRAAEVLRGKAAVYMKLLKDDARLKREKPEKKEEERQTPVRSVDKRLYEELLNLRSEIAKEQNVPAYTVFSNSSLTDMCIKIPSAPEEFLEVSGVGRMKLERYGARFINAITEFVQNNALEELPVETPKELDISEIEISEEYVSVSTVADRINCVLMESGLKKISGKRINDFLVSKGYMVVVTENNKNTKVATDAGEEMGIICEDRVIRGESVKFNLYGRKIQEFIVKNIADI